jgi:hypothetical protein
MLISVPTFMVEHDREMVKPFIAPCEARNPRWRGMADWSLAQHLPLENEVTYGRMERDFSLRKNIKVSYCYYFLNKVVTGYIKARI